MSFQAYLDAIERKTGKTPQQLVDEAHAKGFGADTKSGEIVAWLADDYGLGRGHAMALVHVVKNGPGHQRQARRQHRHATATSPTCCASTASPTAAGLRPLVPVVEPSGRRREVQPGERQRLGEVELALGLARPTGGDLDDDVTGVPPAPRGSRAPRRTAGCPARARGARRAPTRRRRRGAGACSRGPSSRTICHRVGPGGRGVRQVEGHVVVGLRHRVPVRQVGLDLARARARATGTCSRRRAGRRCRARAAPPRRRSRGRSRAASGTAGAARRCRRRARRPARSSGRPSPTGRCPTPAGSRAGSGRAPTARGCRAARTARAARPPRGSAGRSTP